MPDALIPKLSNPVGNAKRSLCWLTNFGCTPTNSRSGQLDGPQKCFRQRMCDKGAGFGLGAEITFSVKFREREVDRKSRDSQLDSQHTRGRKPGSSVAKAARSQLIANLAVKLLVERFRGCAIESNHLERNDRTPAPFVWK